MGVEGSSGFMVQVSLAESRAPGSYITIETIPPGFLMEIQAIKHPYSPIRLMKDPFRRPKQNSPNNAQGRAVILGLDMALDWPQKPLVSLIPIEP